MALQRDRRLSHGGDHGFATNLASRYAVPISSKWAPNCQDKLKHVQALKGQEVRQGWSDVSQGEFVPQNFEMASEEDLAWYNMIPVGREFGSQDYDRLMAEDAVKFASEI